MLIDMLGSCAFRFSGSEKENPSPLIPAFFNFTVQAEILLRTTLTTFTKTALSSCRLTLVNCFPSGPVRGMDPNGNIQCG
jgi:hypothetical protein